MSAVEWNRGKLIGALVAAGLLLPSAIAFAADGGKARPPAITLSTDRISTFTPANADPRLAAEFAGRTPVPGDFKFTPAPSSKRPSQVRVAIRARAATPGQAAARAADLASSNSPVTALTPTSYNLGVSVGWRRFAIAGDLAEVRSGNPAVGKREGAVVAVSYSLNNRLTGRVAASADRNRGGQLGALAGPDNYAVDVGGAYNLSRNIAVTGGVRYRVERDRASTLADQRRDSQAVYVGTAFKF